MIPYNKDIPWQEFARLTIETEDLDPVYCALARVPWTVEQKLRWCAGFTTYYHMGTACMLMDYEGDRWWQMLMQEYTSAPRAAERRHFRGEAGKTAIRKWWMEYRTPEKLMTSCMRPSFMSVLKAGIPQIGTYFAWKVSDFREAVFGADVDWTGCEEHLVQLPKQGLEIMYPGVDSANALRAAASEIAHIKAPPRYERYCGVPEAETIACMVKSYYLRGKQIGADIVEKRHDLQGYGKRAEELLAHMPKEPM